MGRQGSNNNRSPLWRSYLEARWQKRVEEITELSLAYHGAAESGQDAEETRRLLRRTVAARRKLADIEEALGRLTDGSFGQCEHCGSAVPGKLLLAVPESRYCPDCTLESIPAQRGPALGFSPGLPLATGYDYHRAVGVGEDSVDDPADARPVPVTAPAEHHQVRAS
jgi:RNA polymerase-binding transcription factor DksA